MSHGYYSDRCLVTTEINDNTHVNHLLKETMFPRNDYQQDERKKSKLIYARNAQLNLIVV